VKASSKDAFADANAVSRIVLASRRAS